MIETESGKRKRRMDRKEKEELVDERESKAALAEGNIECSVLRKEELALKKRKEAQRRGIEI